ncbi:MAG: universal stress protein [Gammaproteobacteria bacterium]|nr:universal stress protein [Gammaproteobacteria bacterium]
MAFKHILAYVDNDAECSARLQYAVDFAALFDARLTGLYARRLLTVPSYAAVHIPAPVLADYEEVSERMARDAKAAFEQLAGGEGIACEWRLLEGFVPDAIARAAQCTDLVVLPQTADNEADLNETYSTDSVLLKAAAPVLVIPYAGRFQVPAEHVVIAWNNSREAGRAVREALPLLHKSQRITVLSIAEPEREELLGADLGAYLAHHDLQVELKQIPAGDCSTADALLSCIADNTGDLLVMGGYGRSRLLETVLGGTTREILAHMTVPVLMSH